jgi:hypothetical protein
MEIHFRLCVDDVLTMHQGLLFDFMHDKMEYSLGSEEQNTELHLEGLHGVMELVVKQVSNNI